MGTKGIRGCVAFTGTMVLCLLSVIWFSTAPAWAAPLTTVTDTLSDHAAGATATHTVVFTTASSLAKDGQIIITFPAGFDLSKINLGFNLNLFFYWVNGQDVTLQKIFKSPIPANTTFTVPLYHIGNSAVPGNYHISVKTVDPTIQVNGGPQIIDGPTDSSSFSIAAPSPITVIPSLTISNKTYDKTAAAVINGRSLSGVVGSQDVSLTGGTAVFTSVNAGNSIAVNITALSLTGADATKYVLSSTSTTASASITARPLTVTAAADNRIYDGTNHSAAVPLITSGTLASGDTVSFTQTFSNKNAGAGLTLTPAGSVNDSNGGNNYAVSLVNVADGSITPKALTLTGINAANKVYDGNTSATLDVTAASLSGVIGGDAVNLNASGAAGVFSDKNAGTNKTITVSGLTLSGTDAGNYILSSVAPTSAQITARPITVSAVASSKTYDGSTSSAGSPTITGGSLVGGDSASWSQTFSNKNAGNGKTLTPLGSVNDGNGGNNYIVTVVTSTAGVINRAVLTITALTNSRMYDGGIKATAIPTVSGLKDSDAVNGLTETYNNKDAGTGKTLSVSTYTVNDGNGGNNYTVTPINVTTGVINKATPLVNWTKPADISSGTALSGSQLNASAKGVDGSALNGTFTYTPPIATVLSVGNNQTLRVDFTATDTTNYYSVSASVMINVAVLSGSGSGGNGGGGESVGGGSIPAPTSPAITLPRGSTDLATFIDSTGVFKQESSVSSGDNNCSLVIPGSTIAKTADGGALSYVSVLAMTADQGTLAASSGARLIGQVFNLGPEGATFEPPISVSLRYDVAQLPAGAAESSVVIACWDTAAAKWVALAGSHVDTVNHTVGAPVSHFSLYTLLVLPPTQAAFSVSRLTVSPADLPVGQTATISIQVSNSGEASGEYGIRLEVAGSPVETKQITLAGLSNQIVAFNLTQNAPGSFEVVVNGLKGTIRVLPLPSASTPTNAPTLNVKTPVSTPAPGVAILSEPTTTTNGLTKMPVSTSEGPTPAAYLLILAGIFVLTLVATIVVVRIRRSKI
jgi:hypothetical protein